MRKRESSFFMCMTGALVIFVLWYIASNLSGLPIIPSPLLVIKKLVSVFDSKILIHLLYSFGRITVGILCAIVIGVPLGISMGYFPKIERVFSPIIYLTYPVPKVALLPIIMLLFGTGEISKILIIISIIIFQIVLSIRDSVHAIEEEMYYPFLALGASFKDIFFSILWPASMPRFLTALRISTATSISVLFFTETFGTKYGLGYFIMDAWLRVNYLEMYAGIMVLSFMGLALFWFFDFLEYKLCSWNWK